MTSTTLLCLISLVSALTLSGQNAVKPSMDASGKITFGSKSIWLKKGYSQVNMLVADTTSLFGSSLFNYGHGDTSPCFFLNKKMKKDDNCITWTSDIVATRGKTEIIGHYSISLTLQKDDLVKGYCKYTLKPGVKAEKDYFYLAWTGGKKLEGYYTAGSKKVALSSRKYHNFNFQPDMSFCFSPESPEKRIKMIPKIYSKGVINTVGGRIALYPKDGELEFLIDLSGEKQIVHSPEYYGGTDFWKVDRLHLPQYKLCRNLIQNPSFEENFLYYGYKSYGVRYRTENTDIYSIDSKNAKFGKNSLRIKALKQLSLPVSTFAVPLDSKKKYTLSFYAKGNLPKGLVVRVTGRSTKVHWMFKAQPVINITDEWKRYSVSFDSILNFYSIYFQGILDIRSKENEGIVWIDGLQLEEGELTNYTEVPVNVQLTSASRGNFLKFQQKPEFKLVVKSKSSTQASADLTVKNFFGKKIFSGKYNFKTADDGKTVITLSKLDARVLTDNLRGIFVAEVTMKFSGDKNIYHDYFRFSVMNFLDNKHKNKNIFCFSPLHANTLNSAGAERRIARFRDAGFGSAVYLNIDDHKMEEWIFSKLKKYGIADVGCCIIDKRLKNGTIREGNMEVSNIRNMVNPTPEQLKKYEALCELKAKNRPWVTTWYFGGEIEGFKPLVETPAALGKFLAASYRGIKKGNPQAKVHLGGGPWNINKNGIDWYEKYVKTITEANPDIKFDGTEIHIYNQMPEYPDIDASTAAYLEMLKKYGYDKKPVYWDEGMNYFEYFIPKEAMTPYFGNSGDSWYPGMLTYDMGRAERISAAFSARTWLIALKYMKNIACLFDFSMRRYFWDIDLTVGAKMKVVNTLGRILGNADFYKDIRFASKIRCYMFIDENKRPVAAIWGYDTAVDKWEKSAPVFKFDFSKQKVKFFNLMETQCGFPIKSGSTEIPFGPYPLFIIGEPGSEKLLADSIAGGKKLSGSPVPIAISAIPVSPEKVEVSLTNILTSALKAEAAINGKKYQLDLKGNEILNKNINLPENLDVVKKFSFSTTLNSAGYLKKEKKIEGTFTFIPEAPIKLDGKDDDWQKIPASKLDAKNRVKMAICKNTLYIAVYSSSVPTLLINSALNDKDWSDFKTMEQDVYVYEIRKEKKGELHAYAHHVPFVQSASGPWTPKAGRISRYIKGKSGKDFFEIEVAAAGVMPSSLKKGEKIGLNVVLKPDDSVLSLAPVKNYSGAESPGSFKFILSFIR